MLCHNPKTKPGIHCFLFDKRGINLPPYMGFNLDFCLLFFVIEGWILKPCKGLWPINLFAFTCPFDKGRAITSPLSELFDGSCMRLCSDKKPNGIFIIPDG